MVHGFPFIPIHNIHNNIHNIHNNFHNIHNNIHNIHNIHNIMNIFKRSFIKELNRVYTILK